MRYWRLGIVVGLSFLALGMMATQTAPTRAAALPATSPAVLSNGAITETARFYTTTITIPTYPYHTYLREVFAPTYNMTYTVLDWNAYPHANPIPWEYTLLVMENDYLTVTVMPELGGRVYQIIDKATGENHLYQNPVVKPTHWGPPEQGWWLAVGGIEWCLPVEEHGYEWGIPWHWEAITSTAGVTITVWDTDRADRLRATIALRLPADRAYLAVTPRLENPTAAPIAYKFWSNAALAPGALNRPSGDLTFLFHADAMTLHSTGDGRILPPGQPVPTGPDYQFNWPIHNGVDYSRLDNWHEWLGFFEYPQAAADFSGVYSQEGGAGMFRIFPSDVARGVKGFGYGWSSPLPSISWTDDGSGGVELHGGVAPTFWDTAVLTGEQVLSWTEFWYPLRNVSGATQATPEGALHLTEHNGVAQVALHTTASYPISATTLAVWDRLTCVPLEQRILPALQPFTPYTLTTATGSRPLSQLSAAFIGADGEVLLVINEAGCQHTVLPAPHLGYGMNVRRYDRANALVAPLEFEWIKLWEEYMRQEYDALMPPEKLPYHTLYLIECKEDRITDLAVWGDHVETIARAGLGKVAAYEICNEPNLDAFWNETPPDPARFAEMLCVARDRIHAVDPDAFMISGGLAPTGRISGTVNGWPGNNGTVMDERTYLQAMLANGAGNCIDAFGYHPYGFVYAPEQDPAAVENSFAFRGVEALHDILVQAGHTDMPVWATEFNWIRHPEEAGMETCYGNSHYETHFRWQEVSGQQQADYLVRAYQYADRYWPWMQGMFIWNLDWHDFFLGLSCLHSRYYALRYDDGTYLGAPTLAYTAVQMLAKRPGITITPTLTITPLQQTLFVDLSAPRVLTAAFHVNNAGHGTFTWTAQVAPESLFTPTLPVISGVPGEPLWVVVEPTAIHISPYSNTTMFWAGDFTATLRVSTTPTYVLNAPQLITVVVQARPHRTRIYLPLTLRKYSRLPYSDTPHGPSKLGIHAISDDGTTDFVRAVAEGGAHVAVVKGLSFGYLQQIKQISPETITIGRWCDRDWETVHTSGDVQEAAARYMEKHMSLWAPHQAYVDYWEMLNEVDPPSIEGHVWLAQFFIEAMNIAERHGYKLALFSYSMGVPEIYEWQAIAETGVFARAKQGGHILALHEYAYPMSQGWGNPLPQYPGQSLDDPTIPRYPDRGDLTGRYRHLYRDILIPRNEVIPLVISECNLLLTDDPVTRREIFVEEMSWYDDRLREDDYVLGMTIFTLGGDWGELNYSAYLPDLAARIIALKEQ